jgi:hypothetical protein
MGFFAARHRRMISRTSSAARGKDMSSASPDSLDSSRTKEAYRFDRGLIIPASPIRNISLVRTG